MQLNSKEKETLKGYVGKEDRTNRELAEELGISSEHFSRLVNGRVPFTEDRATQLYRTLGEPEELAFLTTAYPDNPDRRGDAWEEVYRTYEQDLFAYFTKAPIAGKTNILEGLERILNQHKPQE